MIRYLALLLLVVPAIASAQFGFGPGPAINIVAAAIPTCTDSITQNYIVTDPASSTDCEGGGGAPLFAELNYCVCDHNVDAWAVLVSTLAPAGAVDSVYGRTGAVVAQANDYSIAQVTGGIAGSTLASTAAGQGATLIGVADAAGNFTAADVEAALVELFDVVDGLAAGGGAPASAPYVTSATDATLTNETVLDDLASLNSLLTTTIADGSHTAGTDLGASATTIQVDITSSTGGGATIPAATITTAGVLTAADKVILDGITVDDQTVNGDWQFEGSVSDSAAFAVFVASDVTPSVLGGTRFITSATPGAITFFDNGVSGQRITVLANAFTVFDCTDSNLVCGDTDIQALVDAYSEWSFDGTKWRMISYAPINQNLGLDETLDTTAPHIWIGANDFGNGIIEITNGSISGLASITPTLGRVAVATNGADKADCTVGGGTSKVLCIANGAAWEAAHELIDLAADYSWTGGHDFGGADLEIPNGTIATMLAITPTSGRMFLIADGTSNVDCFAGGGTTRVLCVANGAGWGPVHKPTDETADYTWTGTHDFTGGDVDLPNDSVDLADIADAILSGVDATLITGTSTNGECATFNIDGDLVGAGGACGTAGGEANTHSSLGGGLAITATVPKDVVDLQLVSLDAGDFNSALDVITVQDDGHAHTTTSISGLDGADLTTGTIPVALVGASHIDLATEIANGLIGESHLDESSGTPLASDVLGYDGAGGFTWVTKQSVGNAATSWQIYNLNLSDLSSRASAQPWTWTGAHDFGGGAVEIQNGAIASLGTATLGRVAIINDGANADDCVTAGGAFIVHCMANGSTWEASGDSGAGGSGGTTSAAGLTQVTNTTDDFAVGWDGAGSASTDFAMHFDEATGALELNVAGASIDAQAHATLGGCVSVKEGADDGGQSVLWCLGDTTSIGASDVAIDAFNASGKLTTAAIGDVSVGTSQIAVGGVENGNLANDAVSLSKMLAGTAGNLITYDAAGDPAAVATGTATHVLTSNGVGLAPTFQVVSAGGTVDSIQGDDNVPTTGAVLSIDGGAGIGTDVVGDVLAITGDHDALPNYVGAEHVDWAGVSAGTIDPTNYADNDTNTLATQGDVTLTAPATGAVLIKSAGDWVNGQLDLADPDAVTGELADTNVSNTLQSSLFVGSGSTTTAIDLATAEVAGTLAGSAVGTGIAGDNITDDSVDMTEIDGTIDLLTTGTIRGMVDVVATTAATDTPAADEMRGSFHTADNTGVVTYTLPAAVAGMSACFYDLDATAILTIEIDGADVITLDGTALAAGNTIDSAGAKGDFVCLLAIDATNWLTLGRSGAWVDGGAT